MQIEGNVYAVGAVQSGTSSNGNQWKKQEVVVEFFEFPTDMWTQKIVVTLMGHNVDDYHLNIGDKVSVRFGLVMNEWKGRYFQEIRLAQDGLKVLSRLGPGQAGETACTVANGEATSEMANGATSTTEEKTATAGKADETMAEPAMPDDEEVSADGLPF